MLPAAEDAWLKAYVGGSPEATAPRCVHFTPIGKRAVPLRTSAVLPRGQAVDKLPARSAQLCCWSQQPSATPDLARSNAERSGRRGPIGSPSSSPPSSRHRLHWAPLSPSSRCRRSTAALTTDGLHARIEAGLSYQSPWGVSVRAAGSYDGLGSDGYHAVQGQARLVVPLQ